MLRELVNKAVRMRKYTVSCKLGYGSNWQVQQWANEWELWLAANKNANDEAIKTRLIRRWDEFKKICPWNKAGKSIMKKVTNQINIQ